MTRLLFVLLPVLSVTLYAHPSETIPPEEGLITPHILKGVEGGMRASMAKLQEQIDKLAEPDEKLQAIRDAHPKAHGCVKAKFEVLPTKHGKGLFAKQHTYDAWIRFSNGADKLQPDFIPDGRGMAIKVVGVEGDRLTLEKTPEKATQDFLMINHPQFFVKNVKDYATFFQDKAGFFKTHKEEGMIGFGIAMQIVTSPLETQYFSMTPVLHHDRPMKYSARPCTEKQSLQIGDLDLRPLIAVLKTLKSPEEIAQHVPALLPKYASYLRQGLKNGLATNGACFEFLVQEQEDTKTEPVEDPTVKWNTKFHTVAKIHIAKQDFTSKDQDKFCENLVLTPWHALTAHEPLGGIQRIRKPIYETIASLRREFNLKNQFATPELQAEPTGKESF